MTKRNVVLGYLGTKLDDGFSESRWTRWRPSIGLCAQPDFKVDRLELFITNQAHERLAQRIASDVGVVSPGTEVRIIPQFVEDPWDFVSIYGGLHDFAKNYVFDLENENYYVHLSTGTHTAQICLFLMTEAKHFPARMAETAMDKAAEESWRGRLNIIDLELAKYDQLAARFEKEHADATSLLKGGIQTRNKAFNKLVTDIETVCLRTTAPILLTGPTGAGKTQMANRIFELRTRRHKVAGRLVEVNCATLRGDAAMSVLFGHKKGAFTGALSDRRGFLLEADGGCLFLDEIGELRLDEQAMLLRALEDKKFFPMGSDKEVKSDFQLIAGTNKNLAAEVEAGRFRADLYARLNTWEFTMPGLASRVEDIEPNLDYELRKSSAALGLNVSINQDARAQYLAFAMSAPWLGNFRDLSASVLRMATLAEGGRIRVEDVSTECSRLLHSWGGCAQVKTDTVLQASPMAPSAGLVAKVAPTLRLDAFDAIQLELVLAAIKESRSMAEAGRTLFEVTRAQRTAPNDSDRVRKYLAKWGLTYAEVKQQLAA